MKEIETNLQAKQHHYQCQRCKNKAVEYVCEECKPINSFCSKCDSFIHTLPSKKNHRRSYFTDQKIKLEDNTPKDSASVVPTNACSNKKEFTYEHFLTENRDQQNDNFNISPLRAHNLSYIDERKLPQLYNHGTLLYTKEYVNELKNIFAKEKDELIFKNNSLQNNLDRLKTSFGDQILNLQKELENCNSKNNQIIKFVEEDHLLKQKKLIQDKDFHVDNLTRQVEDYKKCNEELLEKLRNNIREEKVASKNKLREFNQQLKEKDQEILNIKNFYQNKIDQLVTDFEDRNRDMSNLRDIDFNRLSIEHCKEKDRLEKIIDERERDTKIFADNKRQDEVYLNKFIDELKINNQEMNKDLGNLNSENSSLLKELNLMKNSNQILNEENKMLNNNLERLKKEINVKSDQNKYLENNIASLKSELSSLLNKNNFLEKENENLSQDFENQKFELNRKTQNLGYLQNENNLLKSKNNELTNQLNRFDKMYLNKLNKYEPIK